MRRRLTEILFGIVFGLVYVAVIVFSMNAWYSAGLFWSLLLGWLVLTFWSARRKRERESYIGWREPAVTLLFTGVLYAILWPALPPDLSWRNGVVTDVCFSPDSRLLFWRAGGVVHIREVVSGREIRSLVVTPPRKRSLWPFAVMATEPPAATPRSMVVTPDGATLVVATRDANVTVWDVNSGQRERELTAGDNAVHVATTPDGSILVTGQSSFRLTEQGETAVENSLTLWDLPTGRLLRTIPIPGTTRGIDDMFVSTDGRVWVRTGREILVWDVRIGRRLHTLKPEDMAIGRSSSSGMAVDGGGTRLVTRKWNGLSTDAPDTLVVWDTTTWRPVGQVTSSVGILFAMTLSPDGRMLAEAGPNAVYVRPLNGHGEAQEHRSPRLYGDLVFSPDAKWLAVATWDNEARVWPVSSASPAG